MASVPIIDIDPGQDARQVAEALSAACRDSGFFYIRGHGIDEGLQSRLESLSRQFFARPLAEKMAIAMAKGGRAWRGYFPVGSELTSGRPDLKEGIYFGAELDPDHPAVQRGLPLHGPNLFPARPVALRAVVLEYLAAMTGLGHRLMEGISLSLGLPPDHFARHFTGEPLILFRIFNYPAAGPVDEWGVGEHTDYGVLTILKQDDSGGLEVKSRQGWIAAPPVPGTFVCNIGDMLDRLTRGRYRSTPHRVRNRSGRARLSFPFFFDPGFETKVTPLPLPDEAPDDGKQRWDGQNVHAFQGTYGDYLLGKVGKVFPDLKRAVLE